MAYWYHRNVLKATATQNFDMRFVASTPDANKILSNMRQTRARLLQLLCNPNEDIATLVTTITSYLSLLQGFIIAVDGKSGDSKLRHLLTFRWTDACQGNTPCVMVDAVFEECSMLANMGIWYMKHASKIAGKDDLTMEEAKEVHKSLRLAAGIFSSLQNQYVQMIRENIPACSDLSPTILSTYTAQCLAEAQEVTVARAIELKHQANLVAALCHNTAEKFAQAASTLTSLPPPQQNQKVVKWHRYLQFKQLFYNAYAYCYYGEMKLAQDECGVAVKCVQDGERLYREALDAAKEYSSVKTQGESAKPHQHPFFRRLEPHIRKVKEKCEHENGFIYHQRVPDKAPNLSQLTTEYGLVSAEDFTVPPVSPDWSPDIYLSFDITKHTFHKMPGDKSSTGDLPPVKESKVHQSSKDPKTESGCVLS